MIVTHRVGMLPAIQFNAKFLFVAINIEDISTEWMLPSKFSAGEPAVTQYSPRQRLGIGHLFAHCFCKGTNVVWEFCGVMGETIFHLLAAVLNKYSTTTG